jgi:hypothetical protein
MKEWSCHMEVNIDLLALHPSPGAQRQLRRCKLLVPKGVVGASGFEPPSSWSRTMNTNSINALLESLRDEDPAFSPS